MLQSPNYFNRSATNGVPILSENQHFKQIFVLPFKLNEMCEFIVNNFFSTFSILLQSLHLESLKMKLPDQIRLPCALIIVCTSRYRLFLTFYFEHFSLHPFDSIYLDIYVTPWSTTCIFAINCNIGRSFFEFLLTDTISPLYSLANRYEKYHRNFFQCVCGYCNHGCTWNYTTDCWGTGSGVGPIPILCIFRHSIVRIL